MHPVVFYNGVMPSFGHHSKDPVIYPDEFYHMFHPDALAIVAPYLKEEREVVLRHVMPSSLTVVGCGPLWYLELVPKYCSDYTGVEKLISYFVNDSILGHLEDSKYVKLLRVGFEEMVHRKTGHQTYVFMFNVVSYIPNVNTALTRILNPGDRAIICTWKDTEATKEMRKRYCEFLIARSSASGDSVFHSKQLPCIKLEALLSNFKNTQLIEQEYGRFAIIDIL
jgi:hypothetical protein